VVPVVPVVPVLPVDPVGVLVGLVVESAWVTSKVVVATSPELPVAVTVYVPGDTDGTVNCKLTTLYEYDGVNVPTFAVPSGMLTGLGAVNPDIWTTNNEPAGP